MVFVTCARLTSCLVSTTSLLFFCAVQAPLCLSVELSVAEVATKMAEVRTDAVILLGSQGDMRGIMTDHDVARWGLENIPLMAFGVAFVTISSLPFGLV